MRLLYIKQDYLADYTHCIQALLYLILVADNVFFNAENLKSLSANRTRLFQV